MSIGLVIGSLFHGCGSGSLVLASVGVTVPWQSDILHVHLYFELLCLLYIFDQQWMGTLQGLS